MRLNTNPLSPATYPNGCVRRHRRALFSVPVTLYHLTPGGVRASHGISLDVSEGGMGALVQGDLRVGDTLQIDLPLPGRMLSAVVIVRYSSSARSGFEFVGLTPEERLQIRTVSGAS